MGWSYQDSLPTDKDKVRFYLSDNVVGVQRFSDEEINAVLAMVGDPLEAAATCADKLAAKYSGVASVSIGNFSKSGGQQAQLFSDLAARLRAQMTRRPGGLGIPVLTGASISEMDSNDQNTDRPPSTFTTDLDDNPQVGPSPDPTRRGF